MLIAITTPWFTSIPEPFNEPILTDTKNGFTVDPNTPHPELILLLQLIQVDQIPLLS